MLDSLHQLFQHTWASLTTPSHWNHSDIIPLMKSNTARTHSKFRPISLTSVPGKMLESIINTRLQHVAEHHS